MSEGNPMHALINRALEGMATPPAGERRIVFSPEERAIITSATVDIIKANPQLAANRRYDELASVLTDKLTERGSQTDRIITAAARRQLSGLETMASDDMVRNGVREKLQPFARNMLQENSTAIAEAVAAPAPDRLTPATSLIAQATPAVAQANQKNWHFTFA